MAISPTVVTSTVSFVAHNWDKIKPVLDKTGPALEQVMTGKAIRRFGNNLVWRSAGGTKVIGMLEDINVANARIETAISGVMSGQEALGASLSTLQGLTMVTLGFSALSATVLTAQFVFLKKRLDAIQKELKGIQIRVDQQMIAKVDAAVKFVAQIEPGQQNPDYYAEALSKAREAVPYFLSLATDDNITSKNLEVIQFYARQYFLALGVETASLLGAEKYQEAQRRLNDEEINLKQLANSAFQAVLTKDYELYLSPRFKDQITLMALSDLLQQAQNLGLIPAGEDISPEYVFETNRAKIYNASTSRLSPRFRDFQKTALPRLRLAISMFEETARLISWRDSLRAFEAKGLSVREVQDDLSNFRNTIQSSVPSAAVIAYTI